MQRWARIGVLLAVGSVLAGCKSADPAKQIIFLDGAGHAGAGLAVKRGLNRAGYDGNFDTLRWQSGLLWGVDHLLAARSQRNARKLVREIVDHRRRYPEGFLAVMGLSAGSSVVVSALSQLPPGMQVDSVVLFQSSVSATRNLAPTMRGVRGKLYATCSKSDAILSTLLATSDGGPLPPAGKIGFRVPLGLTPEQRRPYLRVVNLPWRPKYRKLGWRGGHLTATSARFVERVIAPRVLAPLDESPANGNANPPPVRPTRVDRRVRSHHQPFQPTRSGGGSGIEFGAYGTR
jgi:hypothetical protein